MQAAKEDLKESMRKKEEMEKEIEKIEEYILTCEGRDLDKNIVDAEGFPREDLDFMELKEYRIKKKRLNGKFIRTSE